MNDGTITAIDLHTLSNAGAYGEHATTTIGLSGHKSLPIYNHVKASRFSWDAVYTNTNRGGAYRGYGATQGQFCRGERRQRARRHAAHGPGRPAP